MNSLYFKSQRIFLWSCVNCSTSWMALHCPLKKAVHLRAWSRVQYIGYLEEDGADWLNLIKTSTGLDPKMKPNTLLTLLWSSPDGSWAFSQLICAASVVHKGRPMAISLSIEGQPTVTYRVPFAFYYKRALTGDPSYIRVDICKELGPSFLVFDGKTRLQYPVDCSCSEVIYQYIPLPGWFMSLPPSCCLHLDVD